MHKHKHKHACPLCPDKTYEMMHLMLNHLKKHWIEVHPEWFFCSSGLCQEYFLTEEEKNAHYSVCPLSDAHRYKKK